MNDEVRSLYEIRDFRSSDKSFILATFLRGLYYGNEFYKIMPKPVFMENYKQVAEALLGSPKSRVLVACLKDDQDVVLGYSWVSSTEPILHWCFVKKDWRKAGIGKSLIPFIPESYSHFSTLGLDLVKRFPNCHFNPFKF